MAENNPTYSLFFLITTIIITNLLYSNRQNSKQQEKISANNQQQKLKNLPNHLEEKFCLNTFTCTKNDDKNLIELHCSSIHSFFYLLQNGCAKVTTEKEYKETLYYLDKNIEEKEQTDKNNNNKSNENMTEKVLKIPESNKNLERKPKESVVETKENKNEKESNLASLAYLLMGSLLVVSTMFSLVEFYRERKRTVGDETHDCNPSSETSGVGGSGRRLSIVDLTVSRHARKESQRESNLGNSVTGRSPPPLIRRSSFPAQIPEVIHGRARLTSQHRQQTWSPPGTNSPNLSSRRISIDYTEDDSSPDRKRVRIIRRH